MFHCWPTGYRLSWPNNTKDDQKMVKTSHADRSCKAQKSKEHVLVNAAFLEAWIGDWRWPVTCAFLWMLCTGAATAMWFYKDLTGVFNDPATFLVFVLTVTIWTCVYQPCSLQISLQPSSQLTFLERSLYQRKEGYGLNVSIWEELNMCFCPCLLWKINQRLVVHQVQFQLGEVQVECSESFTSSAYPVGIPNPQRSSS